MANRRGSGMNSDDPRHRDLQQRLDEAARLLRPQHSGWDTFLDRLGPQRPGTTQTAGAGTEPEVAAPRRRALRWLAAAVAAGLLIALVFGWPLIPGPERPVQAEPLPIEVQRRGIQITIFGAGQSRQQTLYMPQAANLARRGSTRGADRGMALVKDQRMILHLRRGDNTVKFTDVAASIDPTSVRLVSDTDPLGTKVVEQNFEFDLASADALLERSLERMVACIPKEGKEVYKGYLLGYDGQALVLADKRPSQEPDAARPKTQTVARQKLQAIRLDHVPSDLHTRPTLVWKLRTDTPGDHLTTLTYLCGNVVWSADYVALITDATPNEVTLELAAWVTIDNRSGTAYDEAGLKLVAGDVSRVSDPWAPAERSRRRRQETLGQEKFEWFSVTGLRPVFVQKDLFEYKLYGLNRPSTIKDRQIKQLGLFEADGVKARRRYLCRSIEGNRLHPVVQLLIKNEERNHLGRPLPKGRLRLRARDGDGEIHRLGRFDVDHTAKDEELTIYARRALDVAYDFRVIKTERPAEKRLIRTYEFRIRNHKPQDVRARAIAELREQLELPKLVERPDGTTRKTIEPREAATRSVVRSSEKYFWSDQRTIHFDVLVKSGSQKTITYTVEYAW